MKSIFQLASVIGLLILINSSLQAQPSTTSISIEEQTFTAASGAEVKADVGQLTVLENRSAADSRSIDLAFIRLKSDATSPIAPLVYLEGGPGSSCTWMAERPGALDRWLPLLELGDVILIDQRGTGAASQSMTWINDQPIAADFWINQEAVNTHYQDMAKRALMDWATQGIDIMGYNSVESAKDLEALRESLSLEKISIMGFSYGTHLGQAYMKYFGEHVEKAILIGVEGLNETLKEPMALDAHFKKIAQLVAADPIVGEDVPDMVALYQKVAQKLQESPIDLKVNSPLTGREIEVKVGKQGLDLVLFMDLGDASDLPVIPRLLYSIDQGDYSHFRWFIQKRISHGYGIHAMATTMDIASGASPERIAAIYAQAKESMFENLPNTPNLALLEVWPNVDLGPAYRADFHTNIPTLLLSGTLDRNTPPYQAERLRYNLPNAQHIIVQNAGHEQILNHPQVGIAVAKFLKGEDVSEITAAYPPLRFIPVEGEVGEDFYHPALGD